MTIIKIANEIYEMDTKKKKSISEKTILEILKRLLDLEVFHATKFDGPIESLLELSVAKIEQGLRSETRRRRDVK